MDLPRCGAAEEMGLGPRRPHQSDAALPDGRCVALNLWGVIEGEADAFYETSAKLPRLGEQAMTLSVD